MKKGNQEVFGISFLDLLSCGLAGVLILMIIFSSMVADGTKTGHLKESDSISMKKSSFPVPMNFLLISITIKKVAEQSLPVVEFNGDSSPIGNSWEGRIVRAGNNEYRYLIVNKAVQKNTPNLEFSIRPNNNQQYDILLITPNGKTPPNPYSGFKSFYWSNSNPMLIKEKGQ